MDGQTQTVGRGLVAAGGLMVAGAAGELAFSPQRPDGTVLSPVVFAACVVASVAGTALLATALRAVAGGVATSRSGRWGGRLLLTGLALVALASVSVLVSGLASGAPLEVSFLPWAVGSLLTVPGAVMLGLALRRSRRTEQWWLPVVAGVSMFAALAILLDPWHDVALLASYAAWAALGSSVMSRAIVPDRVHAHH